jgi:hypothetical protein
MNSKRQPKNLKRMLSTVPPNLKTTITQCQNVWINDVVPAIILQKDFNARNFRITANMLCDTRDVIYAITCPGCSEYYIGETNNTLRSRVRVHKQEINTPEYREIQLSAHLETCGNKQFTIFPFINLNTCTPVLSKDVKTIIHD